MSEKCVLISIKPKWCELIANGEKTIEVRKSSPKLETPFKCYIYCTLQGSREAFVEWGKDVVKWNNENWGNRKGNVIGEFICDRIIESTGIYGDELFHTGLAYDDLKEYGKGKLLYGWHISALKIYDKPRELSEFKHRVISGNWERPERITRPPQSWCYVEESSCAL